MLLAVYLTSCSILNESAQAWIDEMMYYLLVEHVELYEEKEIPRCIIRSDEIFALLVVGIVSTLLWCILCLRMELMLPPLLLNYHYLSCVGWASSLEW